MYFKRNVKLQLQTLMSNINVKRLLQNLAFNFKPQLKSSAQYFKWHVSSFIGLTSNNKLQNHQQLAWNCKIWQVSKKGDEGTDWVTWSLLELLITAKNSPSCTEVVHYTEVNIFSVNKLCQRKAMFSNSASNMWLRYAENFWFH